MISGRMGTVALAVSLVACATTPRIQWLELPEVARLESAAAAEQGLQQVYESNSWGSLLLVGNVVYGNRCSGATGLGGASGDTGVGGATGSTAVGGASGSTGVGGASGVTGVGGASRDTGVGGASGSTGVGGATGATGIGGTSGVIACSHGEGGYLIRLPAGTQAYEFDGFEPHMVPQSRIVR